MKRDFNIVKENVNTLINAKAPDSDIDKYLAEEGWTPDEYNATPAESPIGAPIDFTNSDAWLKKQIETAPGATTGPELKALPDQDPEFQFLRDLHPITIAKNMANMDVENASAGQFERLTALRDPIKAALKAVMYPGEVASRGYGAGYELAKGGPIGKYSGQTVVKEESLGSILAKENIPVVENEGALRESVRMLMGMGLDFPFYAGAGELMALPFKKPTTVGEYTGDPIIYAKRQTDMKWANENLTADDIFNYFTGREKLSPELSAKIGQFDKADLKTLFLSKKGKPSVKPQEPVAPVVEKPMAQEPVAPVVTPEPIAVKPAVETPTVFERKNYNPTHISPKGEFYATNLTKSVDEVLGNYSDLSKETRKELEIAADDFAVAQSEGSTTKGISSTKKINKTKDAYIAARYKAIEEFNNTKFGIKEVEPVEKVDIEAAKQELEKSIFTDLENADAVSANEKVDAFLQKHLTDVLTPEEKAGYDMALKQDKALTQQKIKDQVANDIVTRIKSIDKINIDSVRKDFDYDLLDPRLKRALFSKTGGTSLDEMAQSMDLAGGSDELWNKIQNFDWDNRYSLAKSEEGPSIEEGLWPIVKERLAKEIGDKYFSKRQALEASKPASPVSTKEIEQLNELGMNYIPFEKLYPKASSIAKVEPLQPRKSITSKEIESEISSLPGKWSKIDDTTYRSENGNYDVETVKDSEGNIAYRIKDNKTLDYLIDKYVSGDVYFYNTSTIMGAFTEKMLRPVPVKPITEKVKTESGKIVDQGVMEGMTRGEVGNIPTGKIEGTPKEDIDAIMAEIKSGELVGARQGNMDFGENEGNGPKYSMGKEGYTAPEGTQTTGTVKKVIPPVSATGKPIAFEKSTPWDPGRGRNITGVFQKEIGPELQVSTRMKKWLGVYYNVMPSGLIRIRSIADAETLNHETGHFLDDVIGKYPIEKKGNIKDELLRVTRHLDPFEDVYTEGISKKTGKVTKKQDAYTAYRRSRSELFAQYIRMYVGDPIKARELAPGFTGIVEREIAKDKEFKYIIDKLREFEAEFKPVKDFVSALPPIKEMAMEIKNWEAQKNPLTMLWRNKVGDVLWNKIVDVGERVSKKAFIRELVEKRGLSNAVFELLRQRKLLYQGQNARVAEDLIDPINKKLPEEPQEIMASNLQDFSTRKERPVGDLEILTEKAREELAMWGNAHRKLGLLNDPVFWSMTGQYLPSMYSTKEFDANKAAFGFFPTKAIRANLSGFKHKMTNEEFGRKVLEAQLGTWPSSQAKIDAYSAEELAQIGINAREELGLIKTAAYPLQKRISQMIEAYYTVTSFNMMAKIPGIIGNKTTPNYAKMPEAKKFGAMAGQYAPENLVREVGEWAIRPGDIEKVITAVISGWKVLKVPMNTAAVARNILTNIITSWMGDIPLQNPKVLGYGISSMINKDKYYTQMRDAGLFHNTYSAEELQGLAFIAPDDPNFMEKVLEVGSKVFNAPGRLYGFVEDINKLSVGRYVMEHGGSAEEAVKKANSLLFDYSSVSHAVGLARKFPLPVVTWSAKVAPRLIETAIRRPEKYLILLGAIAGASAYARYKLGITKEEEDKAKPDKLRGKTSILLGERDKWGRLQWFDLSWLLPWEGFNPVKNGKLAAPQVLTAGNPFLTFYNAYVLNYDPFYGEIAPEYLPEGERNRLQGQYLYRSLGPQLATTGIPRIYESATVPEKKYSPELLKVAAAEVFGLRVVPEETEKKTMLKNIQKSDKSKGIGAVNKLEKKGIITKEQEKEYKKELRDKYRKYRETH